MKNFELDFKRLLLLMIVFSSVQSCKSRISRKELNYPADKILIEKTNKRISQAIAEGHQPSINLTQKEFREIKNRISNRFLKLRKSLLNSCPSFKSKNFILIEQINMEVFDYVGYLVIDNKIYSSRNGKLSSYQNINSLKEKKPEIGNFIIGVLKNEKPIFNTDDSNTNCYHGCLSSPIVTIVENGKVIDFNEAKGDLKN